MLININQIIKKKSFPPILLMFGEEEFLLNQAYNELIESMLPNRANEFDFEVIDGEEATLKRVLDSCVSFPFMSEKRVVVVKNFEKLAPGKTLKKAEKNNSLKKYLDSPLDTTKLILLTQNKKLNGYASASNNSTKANKIQKLAKFPYDMLLQKYDWVEFPKVYESSYTVWIKQRAKELGKSISPQAIEFLIAQTNQNLRDLNNELEKVVIYMQERKTIEAADITFVVGASRTFNVFELQKAIGKKDIKKSLKIIEKMLRTERQEMLILTMLARYFIILWKLLELAGRGKNNFELAREIGVSPYFVSEYLEALGRYKSNEIDNALRLLTKADETLKSSSQDSIYTLQKMTIELIGS